MTDRQQNAASGTKRPERPVRIWAIALFSGLALLWEGLPFTFFGFEISTGRYFASFLILLGVAGYFLQWLRGRVRMTSWEILSGFLFSYMVFVSFISNNTIFPQPISGWVPALYTIVPVLLIFLCRFLDVRSEEIINGVVVAALIACSLIVLDGIFYLPFMDRFRWVATIDRTQERIILMKLPVAVAALVSVARIISATTAARRTFWIAAFLLAFYSIASVSESRLIVAAMILALAAFVAIMIKGKAKIAAIYVGIIASLIVYPLVIEKYIVHIAQSENYISTDSSIQWRIKTIEFYNTYFDRTHGLGFGVMSTGPDKANIMSFGANKAGLLYGSTGYNLYLADTAIAGALFQFGFVGLGLAIFMTLKTAVRLISLGRKGFVSNRAELGIVGLFVLFMFLSPWPINFFTLEWSLLAGNIFWSIAALGVTENEAARRAIPQRLSRPVAPGAMSPVRFA